VCRRAAAAAFAFAFAHGGQAVVPAAAALHGANKHEICSCGLENDALNDRSKTSCALPHRSRGQVSVGFY